MLAEPLRIATWHTELTGKGPGLILRDIEKREPKAAFVAQTITEYAPDIILLTAIDWDHGGVTLSALADQIGGYPHRMALRPNSGMPTGLDLNRDGRLGGPADAQGYGAYRGQGGMALLSKHPIDLVEDHTEALWADQPDALLFEGMTETELEIQRLFSVGMWEIDVAGLRLIALSATPPVFDGPEDRNGRRNHDELRFVQRLVDTSQDTTVVLGHLNLDSTDGEGRQEAIRALLEHPRLQDPRPKSPGGREAANEDHAGDPALDTADWSEPRPGNLRTDYVLPDAGLKVTAAGVHWPLDIDLSDAPRSRMVWVDIERD